MLKYTPRLKDVWELIPKSHRIILRVKLPDKHEYYTDRLHDTDDLLAPCPYRRQYAKVISIYSIAREITEITIEENEVYMENSK